MTRIHTKNESLKADTGKRHTGLDMIRQRSFLLIAVCWYMGYTHALLEFFLETTKRGGKIERGSPKCTTFLSRKSTSSVPLEILPSC